MVLRHLTRVRLLTLTLSLMQEPPKSLQRRRRLIHLSRPHRAELARLARELSLRAKLLSHQAAILAGAPGDADLRLIEREVKRASARTTALLRPGPAGRARKRGEYHE